MTLTELRAKMPHKELMMWFRYSMEVMPLSPEVEQIGIAQLTALTANINSKKKFTTADFLPQWGMKPDNSNRISEVDGLDEILMSGLVIDQRSDT